MMRDNDPQKILMDKVKAYESVAVEIENLKRETK